MARGGNIIKGAAYGLIAWSAASALHEHAADNWDKAQTAEHRNVHFTWAEKFNVGHNNIIGGTLDGITDYVGNAVEFTEAFAETVSGDAPSKQVGEYVGYAALEGALSLVVFAAGGLVTAKVIAPPNVRQ